MLWENAFGTLGWSQARKKGTQKGAELFTKVVPGLESKIIRACLVSLRVRNRCVLFVVSARKPPTSSRAAGLRQKSGGASASDSLQLSALLSNDSVHNSSVPESFTIAWSTRMRNTGYMAEGSQERASQRNAGRADVRRHGELFIKPSFQRNFRSYGISCHGTGYKYKVMPISSKISYAHGEKFMMVVLSYWKVGSLGDYYGY